MIGSSSSGVNPFVGPRPLETGQQIFGRDREIEELYYLLSAERIVLLHSPSGAGKSSLIRAGLIPKLEERFDVRGPTRVNTPPPEGAGVNRYVRSANLGFEQGLPKERRRADDLVSSMSLAEYVEGRPRRRSAPQNVVLIFDQFEEILAVDPLAFDAKREFFRQLGELLQDPRIWALFALREDYLAQFDPYADRIPTHLKNRFRVDLLSRAAAQEAMAETAKVGGRTFAQDAVEKLVIDLATMKVQQPDGSFESQAGPHVEPLHLQVACRGLWERMPADDRTIDAEEVERFGNVTDALVSYYGNSVAGLAGGSDVVERAVREWVDKRLITLDGIRGQVLKGKDKSEGLDNELISGLVDTHLVRAEQRAGAVWFELSHDRLIEPVHASNRQWFDAKLHSFQKIAAVWEAQHRPDALLFVGAALDEAKRWVEANGAFVTDSEQSFLEKSREKQRAVEREREAEQEKAEAQARYAQRMLWATVCSFALFVVAVVVGVLAYTQKVEAEKQKAEAQASLKQAQITQSRLLVQEAEQDPSDHSKTILLALEALPDAKEQRYRPIVVDAQKILSEGINNLRELFLLKGHTGPVFSGAVTPDGARIVTGSDDKTARVWDASTGAGLFQLEGHKGAVRGVAVTPDGARIVTGSADNTARVWDASTGAELLRLEGHTGPILSVAVTPDGGRIVTGSSDRTARMWDASTGAGLLRLEGHKGAVRGVAVTPDGGRIVTGSSDRTARMWDASTGAELFQLEGHKGAVSGVAVTPDGARIVTGSADNTARVWDASTGAELFQLEGHKGAVRTVAVTPDGARIVTSSDDNTARLWDARTGGELLRLEGHTGPVVAVTPDGARIVTGSDDNTALVWDARTGAELFQLEGQKGAVRTVAVTPDGARIVTGSDDNTARVSDAWTGAGLFQLEGHKGAVRGVAVTPDGARIVTGSDDNTARVWDASTGAELLRLEGHTGPILSVAVTPDGGRIVTGSSDRTARMWDASTGAGLFQLEGHKGAVRGVAVTPDGARIVTGSADNTARVWDASTGAELLRLEGHTGPILSVAVTPDGGRIVTGSSDRTARMWDASTGAGLLRLEGHKGDVRTVAVTPDGGRIVTGSSDRTARMWDASTGAELFQLEGHKGAVSGVAVTPDGARIVTGSADNTARVWGLAQLRPPRQHQFDTLQALQASVDHGKAVVPRCLTIEQRQTFLLRPSPPNWCIDMDKYPYDTKYWKAWRAGERGDAIVDSATAEAYGNFADAALKAGDFEIALEAAELGIKFDPAQIWITMNRAHALMFLGRTQAARKEYLEHRDAHLTQGGGGPWEKVLVNDFQNLRKEGRVHPLMTEIEQLFKPSLPVSPTPQGE